VRVGAEAGRAATVSCIWYEPGILALMLGMNPANARHSLTPKITPYSGAEYDVRLVEAGAEIASGRTTLAEEVPRCLRDWLSGASLDAVVTGADFIDRGPRRIRALAAQLDPSVRASITDTSRHALEARAGARSFRLSMLRDVAVCTLYAGPAALAATTADEAIFAGTRAWLIERVDVAALPSIDERITVNRHAEWFERDAARWHWLHVRDRLNDEDDVLTPLRPLLVRLAESPIATRFFSYTSLYRLCFSASSHYPWVNQGLPTIDPNRTPDAVTVDGQQLSIDEAVGYIERVLAAYPIAPDRGITRTANFPDDD
jgi:hypothetical protein